MSELTAALATIEKCREITGCPAGLDLQDHLRQLAAENVAMKQIIDSVTNLDNEPQYHAEGMGCGLEDRGITDRYDACRYGWDEAMERIYGEVIPCADELDFSATDAYLAGIKADAAAPLVSALKVIANSEQHNGDTVVCDFDTLISVAACALRDYYAMQLREGGDKC